MCRRADCSARSTASSSWEDGEEGSCNEWENEDGEMMRVIEEVKHGSFRFIEESWEGGTEGGGCNGRDRMRVIEEMKLRTRKTKSALPITSAN